MGTGAFARPAKRSEATRPPLSRPSRAHFSLFADKTGLCFKTGPTGMLMPRRQATTIGSSLPRGGVGVNGIGFEIQPFDQAGLTAVKSCIRDSPEYLAAHTKVQSKHG